MPHVPTITATQTDDGYELRRGGVKLGLIFQVPAGWVTTACYGRNWRRSRPYPTASEAAFARWGDMGRDAILARETVPEEA